jgi:HD-GYP domain-containing protein (c-di-GMP phosphodiesterase class II)
MGGDEFCALLDGRDDAPERLGAIAARALVARGDGFTVGCSFGVVAVPADARDAEEALRIADQRMYAHKHGGRVPVGRQSTDVLLRVLAERDPGLAGHTRTVADLARSLAETLGLVGDDAREVEHAAELHDIGKVAVPDDILLKPGPLGDDEWTFMRRHTVIGERIVAAAPALGGVAALVRSSHERMDGAGYPDGLAGEAIPLGSRIVAVCEAYDAMTEDRPYRAALPPAFALAELRRSAGTQFDPRVVEAFCALHAADDPGGDGDAFAEQRAAA